MISYRGALFLNHMAIDLIQQGSYSHGLATLKDAIALIKASFATRSSSSLHDLEVEAKVSLARDRLTQSAKQAALPLRPTPHSIRIVDSFLTIGTMELSMCQDENTSPAFPIILVRLDLDSTVNDNASPTSPDFESAVLLQNMGAAYYCLSHQKQQQPRELNQFLTVAIRLWQMSRDILKKLIKGHEQHLLVLPEVLHVAIVAMQNQIQALTRQGDDSDQQKQQQQQQQQNREDTIATSRATLSKLRCALRLMLDKVDELRLLSLHLAPAA